MHAREEAAADTESIHFRSESVKKFFKIFGIIAAVLVVLIVVLAILAKVLVTPERIKQTVLPKAEEALHRQVSLGDVDISLFSGITLTDLVVKEKQGPAAFIAANKVVLRYQFWPLLLGKVVIDEIRLEGPKIRVERFNNGLFNFSDLATSGEKSSKPSPVATSSHPVDLLVSDVSVSHGQILFLDHSISQRAPFRYTLSDLTAQATDISLDRSFPFQVTTHINGSILKLKGELNAKTRKGKLAVTVNDLDAMAFAPYFQKKVPGQLRGLKIDLDVEVDGGPDSLASQGKIGLKDVNLILNAFKGAPIRDAALSLDYDITANRATSQLDIKKAEAKFNGIPLTLTGTVTQYMTDPQVDLSLACSKWDLRSVVKAVPPGLVKGVANMDPAGIVDANLHLAGSLKTPGKLLQKGDVTLTGVSANAGGLRPAVTGELDLQADSLKSKDLTLKLGDNTADIDLQVSHFMSRPVVVSSRLSADSFALDPLLKGTAAGAASQKKGSAKEPAKELGPLDLPVQMTGAVLVKKILYKGLPIKDFDLTYHLEKNILTVDRMTGKVAGGTFSKTARVDLAKKGFVYSGHSEVKGVQADPVVSGFFPKAAGTVFGTLNLDLDYSGQGTQFDVLRKNLSGKGNFLLTNVKLTGAGLVRGLADFLNLQQLRTLHFDRAQGDFRIVKGKVHVSSAFNGAEVRLHPTGTVGLDGSLDLALNTALAPALAKKWAPQGGLSQILTEKDGWSQIPLKVAGTVTSPRLALDTTQVKKKLQKRAGEEIQKKIEEKLFKQQPTQKGASQGKQQPAKKMLENAVKGLFGK